MRVISDIEEMRHACQTAQRPLGLVPTMGYLHAGHMALVAAARKANPTVAVTIFVNPTQFAPTEDLASYPRDLERDLSMLREAHADLVFTPRTEDIYPPDFDTWVDMGKMGQLLEGKFRPGHFRGVATVVTKLFNITRPDRAYFGQKDGQQSRIIRKLVKDLNMGIEIVVVPTVREPDGLALSSRNVYLTPEERRAAPAIYRSLCRARELWQQGERDAERLRQEVRAILEKEPLFSKIDYVSVADADTLEELEVVDRPAMVSLAARIGRARLIDNILLQ